MTISKENEEFIYNFIKDNLGFMPSVDPHAPFLPFAINRPFTVYDISQMTGDQIELLYELVPAALANCLPKGYQLYAVDWFHNFVLYDPRNPSTAQSTEPAIPQYTKDGLAYFHDFYPDGDYYFFLDKYGTFGYLSHPWRQEIWVYGLALVEEFKKIDKQLGLIVKAQLQ